MVAVNEISWTVMSYYLMQVKTFIVRILHFKMATS